MWKSNLYFHIKPNNALMQSLSQDNTKFVHHLYQAIATLDQNSKDPPQNLYLSQDYHC